MRWIPLLIWLFVMAWMSPLVAGLLVIVAVAAPIALLFGLAWAAADMGHGWLALVFFALGCLACYVVERIASPPRARP